MSSSATRRKPAVMEPLRRGKKPIVGFVVGKYFAMHPDKTVDYNGITRNIEEAVKWAIELWREGILIFTPHLNTHHFESKTRIDTDPVKNEEFYRAFDRRLLADGIDFIFATPNWRQSSGGRLEVQLACLLKIPVFESVADVLEWAGGGKHYSTVKYHSISDEAKNFGGTDVKIALIDGPYWADEGAELDMQTVRHNADVAERTAIALFNNRVAVFAPHLNASYARLGYRVPDGLFHLLSDEIISRVADCLYVLPGWQGCPETRSRVATAGKLGKPAFESLNECLAWRDGSKDFFTVVIND